MKKFSISRINTDFGIFRVSGLWDAECSEALCIKSIELMSTDGWVLLNQSSDKIVSLITDIDPLLQAHLLLKVRKYNKLIKRDF